MIERIKDYEGKLGHIAIDKYTDGGKAEYHVTHSNPNIPNYWSLNKRDAIAYAQFLAGKY